MVAVAMRMTGAIETGSNAKLHSDDDGGEDDKDIGDNGCARADKKQMQWKRGPLPIRSPAFPMVHDSLPSHG